MKSHRMKVLVTGSAGFIGSHLVDFLLEKNYQVFGIDDLSTGFKRNINPRSTFYKLDLRKKSDVEMLFTKIRPQLIFHLAADATEGRSQFTPIEATERNYNAYLNVLVAGIKAGELKRMVLTSSISVYGNQKPPFSETMPKKPVDVYGIAKSAMEDVTHVLSNVYKFQYTIVRPHNVYGPRQDLSDPYRNVIGIFINRQLMRKHFFIYGDGTQKRAFTYIDDAAPYIAKAGLLRKTEGETINIGPQIIYTVNDIANEILSHFVLDQKNIPNKLKPVYLPKRPQEVKQAICTDKKARLLLGFKESTPLHEGIQKTVIWAKAFGPQNFRYLEKLELTSKELPRTWKDKLL